MNRFDRVTSRHTPPHHITARHTTTPHSTPPHTVSWHITDADCTCQPESEGRTSGYWVVQAHTLCARRRVRAGRSTHWTVIQTLACTCSSFMCMVIEMNIFIFMLMSMYMLMLMYAIVSALISLFLNCNECKCMFDSKREINWKPYHKQMKCN
jgi:hypothetical protein